MARKKTTDSSRRRTTKRTTSRRGQGATGRRASSGKSAANATGLSHSALRPKWIDSVDAHEDYPGQTLGTRSHEVIRRWAEERGAIPATVPGTEHDGRPGVLTFDFPGYGGERLPQMNWDEWFEVFDEQNFVFVFQEHLTSERASYHFHLDSARREAA